jgi:hypothetical protein
MSYGSGLTRAAHLLTHRSIEAMRPAEAAYRVPDQRCKGLAVRVAPSGIKTLDLAYRIRGTGKMRRLSLGRTTDIGLEQARERANELTSAARGGRDLIAEEDEARAAAASRTTVESLIDLYLRRRVIGRLRTAKGIESRLKRTLAPILERSARSPAISPQRAPVRSSSFRFSAASEESASDSSHFHSFSISSTFRNRSRGVPGSYEFSPAVGSVSTMSCDSAQRNMAPTAPYPNRRRRPGARECPGGRFLRREAEKRRQTEEIDCQKWIWTLPAERSKNGRQRVTPIVGVAPEILAQRLSNIEKGPMYVAENGSVLTSAHLGHYLLTRGARLPIAKFTGHDLRRTFATMVAEMGVALDLVAAILSPSSCAIWRGR